VLTSGEAHVLVNPDGDIKVKAASWLNLFKTIGEWQWTRPATAPTIGSRTLTELKEEYGILAGEKALASLPKKIDKDTVAVLIYKHEWVEGRLLQKEHTFY
jgi:hypothetical protein